MSETTPISIPDELVLPAQGSAELGKGFLFLHKLYGD